MWTGLALLLLALLSSACNSVALNDRCEWPEKVWTDQPLRERVQLAEDLAIRFADAHGETPEWRTNRENCETRLFGRIADEQGVSLAAVLEARQSLTDRPFDWPVNLPMAVLTVVLGWAWGRWVTRRFAADERLVGSLAVGVGAVAIALVIVAVGQIWAGALETWRTGNGHLSYRALRIPWQHHRITTFMLATATVLFVCAIEVSRRLTRS